MLDWTKKITVADKQLEREKSLRAQRDQAIRDTDWQMIRHRDELDLGNMTTLTAEEYQGLLKYRQSLRDWPTIEGWADMGIPTK